MADEFNTAVSQEEEPPDIAAARAHFRGNIASWREQNPGKEFGLWDAVRAGWQGSASGLLLRGQMPDVQLPEDVGIGTRLLSKAVGMAADLPEMAIGGLVGAIEGIPGGPIGAGAVGGAGAFAAPAALRGFLMDRYARGEYQNAGQMWDRIAPVLLDTAKEATIGAATMGMGKAVGLGTELMSPAVRALATGGSELATLTAVGAAVHQQMPTLQDVMDNAILIGGSHGAFKVAGKLSHIYARHGVLPKDQVKAAQESPRIQASFASNDPPEATERLLFGPPDVASPPADSISLSPALVESPPAPTVADTFPVGTSASIDWAEIGRPRGDGAGQWAPADTPTTPERLLAGDTVTEAQRRAGITRAVATGARLAGDRFPEPPTELQKRAGVSQAAETGARLAEERYGGAAESPDLAEAEKEFDAKTVRGDTPAPRESWYDKFTRWYQNTVNGAQKIWQLDGELARGKGLASLNPGVYAENLRVSSAISATWLEQMPRQFGNDRAPIEGAEPLARVYQDVGKTAPVNAGGDPLVEFDRFVKAKQADWIHRNRPKEKTGFTHDGARLIAESPEYVAKYGPLADRWQGYKSHLIDYLVDAGRITDTAAISMKAKDPFHANLFRVVDDIEGGGDGGRPKKGAAFNKREGSDRLTEDSLAAVIKETHRIIRLAEENRLGQILKARADVDFAERNLRGASPEDSRNAFINKAKDQGGAPGKNQRAIWTEGQREIYDLHPELAASLDSLSPQGASVLVKFISVPAVFTRAGFTGTPDFSFKHIFRAGFLAPIISENTSISDPLSMLPFGQMAKGLHGLLNPARVAEAEVHGAMRGGLMELSRETLQGEVFALSKQTGLMDRAYNVVRHPLDAFLAASHAIVNTATRATALAEFESARANGKSPAQAAFEARQIGLDYTRTGSSDFMRNLNRVTSFQNAGVQGIDTIARAFKRDPAGAFLKSMIYVGVPTILNWYHNRGDSRVASASQWQKDLFNLVPVDKWETSTEEAAAFYPDDLKRQREDGSWSVNNGPMFRLPKAFEAGIFFGSLIERTLDKLENDNPRAFEGFDHSLMHSVPGAIPTFMQPILEHWANKSVLTGNPLVSHAAEKLLPEFRYNDYTTETAKYLGKFAGTVPYGESIGLASPAILENYIREWTGTLGMYALHASDAALEAAGVTNTPPKPLGTMADWPVVKAFIVRHPSAGMAELEEFHSNYEEASQKMATITSLMRDGNIKEANKLQGLAWNEDLINAGLTPGADETGAPAPPPKLTGTNAAIGNLHRLVHQINIDPTMTPADKQQLINGYYYQMNQLARYGNEMYRTFAKAVDDVPRANRTPEPGVPGLMEKGNIDLNSRPTVHNADGSVSTVRSMSFEQDGREVLVPTVSDGGQVLDESAAIAEYQRTGKHLGIFRDAASATEYAGKLHDEFAQGKYKTNEVKRGTR